MVGMEKIQPAVAAAYAPTVMIKSNEPEKKKEANLKEENIDGK